MGRESNRPFVICAFVILTEADMRRSIVIALTCLAFAGSHRAARAVFFDDTAHYIKHGYRENKMWPWPYTCPDRISVRDPFNMMIDAGWRRQNLLGPHHFNPDTNQLTTAGELRVQWIMTQAPPDRRNMFVERGLGPNVNTQRAASSRH